MTSNYKLTGKALSMPAGLAIGTGISLGLTMLASALLAKLINTERIEWEQVGYGIMVMLLSASMIGTKTACAVVKRRKMMICAVEGALFWLSLLLITALFFGGQYSGVMTTGIVILAANFIVCILELGKGRGVRKLQRNPKYRGAMSVRTHK